MLNGLTKSFNFQGRTYNVKNYDRVASDLYVDSPLTNVSIAYKNLDYIADLVIPRIPVVTETGLVWKMGMENFNLKGMERGAKSKSKQSSYTVDHDTTYRIINYALHDVVEPAMVNQAGPGMNVDADTTEYLTESLLLNKEYKVASALFNGTTFASYTEALSTSASRYRWDDYVNSAPMDDAKYALNSKIAANSGATSDIALVIGADVWTSLSEHPDLLDRIKYTQMGIVTEDLVKTAFGISNLYIGKAMYNSANEGQAASLSRVWGKSALFFHRGRPALKTAATAGLIHGGNWVRRWNDPYLQNATVIEVQEAFEAKVLSARSGYYFTTVVS